MSELSKPVAWISESNLRNLSKGVNAVYVKNEPVLAKPVALYSQEYVSALLAELEASNKREDGYREKWVAELSNLQDAGKRIAELEAKLATPVRLSRRYETAGYCINEHYCQEAADGDYLDRDELIASLREQGFTVEGDE